MSTPYDDIIRLPHPRSLRHCPMSRQNRAAQFAPFAALNGYEDAIDETSRLTDRAPGTDEEALSLMNEKLHALLDVIRDQPEVTITFFEPDPHKEGGAYMRVSGRIRRVDEVSRQLILTDRTAIAMDSICEIDCLLENE